MQFATVKSSWVSMHPTSRMDAGFWTTVVKTAQDKGIDFENDSLMYKIIMEVEETYGKKPKKFALTKELKQRYMTMIHNLNLDNCDYDNGVVFHCHDGKAITPEELEQIKELVRVIPKLLDRR